MGIVDGRANKRTLLCSPAACSAPAPRMQESRVSMFERVCPRGHRLTSRGGRNSVRVLLGHFLVASRHGK